MNSKSASNVRKLSKYILYQQNMDTNERVSVIPNIVTDINHLNYALTWYFLCLTLCVIFFIYFKKDSTSDD